MSEEDFQRIPKTGPVIITANHPFGAIEGIMLISILLKVRPDIRVMANYLLGCIYELRQHLIFVDPFEGNSAASYNLKPLREGIRWVEQGGALGIFPAGEVAHMDFQTGQVSEAAWNSYLGLLAQRCKATVVSVYFSGRNSLAFHLAGLLHARLRTAVLPRELLNKHSMQFDVKVGVPVSPKRIAAFESRNELTEYLQLRNRLLAYRSEKKETGASSVHRMEKVANTVSVALLEEDVNGLSNENSLARQDELSVWIARAEQIPHILQEIGRLREITFRAVGEGTGRASDLDQFDRHYHHLFIWNEKKKEVVGAYRLGRVDQILQQKGVNGLYTNTLFRYGKKWLEKHQESLELGRSFVRQEYQRSYASLLMLWKGIGQFIVRHPVYRYLFGPVSISNEYHPYSQHLIIKCFEGLVDAKTDQNNCVKPRAPYRTPYRGDLNKIVKALNDVDVISELIKEIENNHRGIPVLLRQYLRLGGQVLCFNRDRDFSDVLDALICVDIHQADVAVLARYMGRTGAEKYLSQDH